MIFNSVRNIWNIPLFWMGIHLFWKGIRPVCTCLLKDKNTFFNVVSGSVNKTRLFITTHYDRSYTF